MTDAPQEYFTVPKIVEAWQITHENIHQVAKWVPGGRVKGESIVFPGIRDRSKVLHGAENNRYGTIGQYLIKTSKGFDVQSAELFEKNHRVGTRRSTTAQG